MLARLTSKNQLTLPNAVVDEFEDVLYFDVAAEGGRVILTPVQLSGPDAVRAKLFELDISEADVAEAVRWARQD